MDIMLIAGLWLRATVWEGTAAELARLGHRPIPVELPGVDDEDPDATLADQIGAVLAAVDHADRPLVVGHSAAATLAWMAADRRPDTVAGAVMVGGFPPASGGLYADFFEIVDGVMPFPGWEPFEGPDSDDIDDATKQRVAAETVPVPEGVARGTVELTDERRHDVPVTMVCPEYSPDDVVDIDSGHWPMGTRPLELARILAAVAAR